MSYITNNIGKLIAGVALTATLAITAHLSLNEVTVTNTGLPNNPDSIAVVNLKAVGENIYEPVRAHFNSPVYVSSAFRCQKVNTAVGGAMRSQHLRGEALDLDPKVYGHLTNQALWQFVKDSLVFDQLIMEGGSRGWVHISYKKERAKNRHQAFKIDNP
ncbi:MAG: D-Ala-D-Ala carboxypeptidase family metallohydrolase [Coriobacteriia bacterium]